MAFGQPLRNAFSRRALLTSTGLTGIGALASSVAGQAARNPDAHPAAVFDDLLDFRVGDSDMTMGDVPSRVITLQTTRQWYQKADALRHIFQQTLGERPDIVCALDARTLYEAEIDGLDLRRVEYRSEVDDVVPAYLLIPKAAKGKRVPAVVCVHPTAEMGKDGGIGRDLRPRGLTHAYALHLAKRGYITLTYDLVNAGERRFAGTRAFDTAPFYQKHPRWSIRGKDVWDVGRAIDYLSTIPAVDSSRIGIIGHSLGACILVHAAALDTRIKVAVSNCGWFPARLSKNPFVHARTGWWCDAPHLRPYAWAGKPFPVDLHEHLALIAPRALLHIHALNDELHDQTEEPVIRSAFENMGQNIDRIYEILGAAGKHQQVLHMRGHSFLEEERTIAYSFFDKHL